MEGDSANYFYLGAFFEVLYYYIIRIFQMIVLFL